MKKNIHFTFIALLAFLNSLLSQNTLGRMYKPSEVIITADGITMYEKWNVFFGDSIRKNDSDTPIEGWMEDLYENGQTLHNGFYVGGRLNSYINLYMNGIEERAFKRNNDTKGNMKKYYETGRLKSDIEYFKKIPLKLKELYADGQVKNSLAYDKTGTYLLYRKAYFEDKKPQIKLELIDPKEIIYNSKEYYGSGDLKAEGELKFNASTKSYDEVGKWKYFDETGYPVADKPLAIKAQVDQAPNLAASATGAKNSKTLPPDIKPADKNNDEMISPDEISSSIDAFFDGDARFTSAKIAALIDFFFQQ